MFNIVNLVKARVTWIWLILALATVVTWLIGSNFGLNNRIAADFAILLIAFIKIWLVGLYFMDLRAAPRILRGMFESYCLIVGALIIGFLLIS